MTYVLDACCAINLYEGRVLEQVVRAATLRFVVGPVSLDETGPLDVLQGLIEQGSLGALDDTNIPLARFEEMRRYRLGPGETESLMFAQDLGHGVATDDGKARDVVARVLGRSRLIGTIGILRAVVTERLLSRDDAVAAYSAMLDAGGFLPKLSPAHLIPPT